MNVMQVLNDYINYHLFLSAFLGLLIGLEREISGKDPGLRTFALISMGSCIFTMLSVWSVGPDIGADRGRIAAQVVAGIGFLGAGTIFRSPKGVSGLTTAALMWVTAAIGMAVGFDKIDLAISATILTLIIVVAIGVFHNMTRRSLTKESDGQGSKTQGG